MTGTKTEVLRLVREYATGMGVRPLEDAFTAYQAVSDAVDQLTAPVLDRAAWTIVQHPAGDYLRAEVGDHVVYADRHTMDVEVSAFETVRYTADTTRVLAARLAEAAAFIEGGAV